MKMSVGFPFSLCYCRDYVAIAPEIYSDGCFVDIKISSKNEFSMEKEILNSLRRS